MLGPPNDAEAFARLRGTTVGGAGAAEGRGGGVRSEELEGFLAELLAEAWSVSVPDIEIFPLRLSRSQVYLLVRCFDRSRSPEYFQGSGSEYEDVYYDIMAQALEWMVSSGSTLSPSASRIIKKAQMYLEMQLGDRATKVQSPASIGGAR